MRTEYGFVVAKAYFIKECCLMGELLQ
ncbi:hypothetical protein Golob_004691 [Gossypium lobatum]|uniref:Uncharacterized protein n=1 Tax=Gossypium lobatum TaxID=34289 RepID=A0A7J8N2D5_9ROSI|nr:hypothetical protein [Gossypium lobatum]